MIDIKIGGWIWIYFIYNICILLLFVEVVNIFYIRIYIFNEICLMYVYFLLGIDKKKLYFNLW